MNSRRTRLHFQLLVLALALCSACATNGAWRSRPLPVADNGLSLDSAESLENTPYYHVSEEAIPGIPGLGMQARNLESNGFEFLHARFDTAIPLTDELLRPWWNELFLAVPASGDDPKEWLSQLQGLGYLQDDLTPSDKFANSDHTEFSENVSETLSWDPNAADKLYDLVNLALPLRSQYERHEDAMGGMVIGTDIARDLFKPIGYNGSNALAFQKPAQQLSTRMWNIRVAMIERGELGAHLGNTFLFTGGGTGAGKSYHLRKFATEPRHNDRFDEIMVVYDSTLSNASWAIEDIEKVKKIRRAWPDGGTAGANVMVMIVFRNPLSAFIDGVLPRGIRDGRIVSVSDFLDSHRECHRAAIEIVEHYSENIGDDNRVRFRVVYNAERNDMTTEPEIKYSNETDFSKWFTDKRTQGYLWDDETNEKEMATCEALVVALGNAYLKGHAIRNGGVSKLSLDTLERYFLDGRRVETKIKVLRCLVELSKDKSRVAETLENLHAQYPASIVSTPVLPPEDYVHAIRRFISFFASEDFLRPLSAQDRALVQGLTAEGLAEEPTKSTRLMRGIFHPAQFKQRYKIAAVCQASNSHAPAFPWETHCSDMLMFAQ